MFDPMALIALPFEDGAIPLPETAAGPCVPVLRARPSAALRRELFLCEQGAKPLHDALAAQGAQVSPRLDPEPAGVPVAALALTRSKAENRAMLARAWAMTAPGGHVILAGAKTDGVESLQKELRRHVALAGVQPRAHGRVIWIERTAETPAVFADWQAEASRAPRVTEGGRGWTTDAGLFSWTEVDPGSAMLAEALPPLKGLVADLGAGWGWLSGKILAASPDVSRIDLYEAETAGIDCARANLSDERAAFHWADVAAHGAVRPRTYDVVVANPPFHEGRNVAMHLGQAFVGAASSALRASGSFWMVCNQQLPYERELEARFGHVELVARDSRYKIFRAARPKKA